MEKFFISSDSYTNYSEMVKRNEMKTCAADGVDGGLQTPCKVAKLRPNGMFRSTTE